MDAAGVVLLSGLVFWVVIATLVGGLVGSRKGRGGLGALLGFLLGWIGVLIIAIMKPSQQFEEQKTIAQAKVLREALGGGLVTATPPPSTGVVITPKVRQDLMLEAIRRDPSLAASSDPETLKRLGDTMEALEKEYVLKAELDQLKANQEASAAAAEEAVQSQKLADERTLAAAAVEAANQLEAERKAEQRATEIEAMSPVRRFIVTKPGISIGALAIALGLVALAIYLPIKNAAEEKVAAEVAAAELAKARSTACETDIDPVETIIGSKWISDSGKSWLTFSDSCIAAGPGLKDPDQLSLKKWTRDGDTVKMTYGSMRWVLKIENDSMTVESVQIDGEGILDPADKTLSYTREK